MGFLVVDRLASVHRIPVNRKIAGSRIGQGHIRDVDVILSKPETFMNRSGFAVTALLQWAGARPEDLVVVVDDMDLDLGVIRIRPQGSSGGHRGVASMVEVLGTEQFPRTRIGIGRPPPGRDPAEYVLSPFGKEELPRISEAVEKTAEAVEEIIAGNIIAAMNRYNG